MEAKLKHFKEEYTKLMAEMQQSHDQYIGCMTAMHPSSSLHMLSPPPQNSSLLFPIALIDEKLTLPRPTSRQSLDERIQGLFQKHVMSCSKFLRSLLFLIGFLLGNSLMRLDFDENSL